MPVDSGGNVTRPSSPLPVSGQTADAPQVNVPVNDIYAVLNMLMFLDGRKSLRGDIPMNGYRAVNAADGVNPQDYMTLAQAGRILPVGAGCDWWRPVAPIGWAFAYGQECTNATPLLRQAWINDGYPFGQANGNPLFPDKRGRSSFGKDDMGGTSANRITNQSGGWNGDNLGAAGGAEVHPLSIQQLPVVTPQGSVSTTVNLSGSAAVSISSGGGGTNGFGGAVGNAYSQQPITVTSAASSFSGTPFGSGQSHNNLPPGITCNYIIFTGALS